VKKLPMNFSMLNIEGKVEMKSHEEKLAPSARGNVRRNVEIETQL
jgi:hypothetical protein